MYVLSCVACMCVSVSSMLVSEIITDLVASTFGICLVSTWRGPLQATDTYCREVMRGFFSCFKKLTHPLQTVPASGFRQGVGSAALGFPMGE